MRLLVSRFTSVLTACSRARLRNKQSNFGNRRLAPVEEVIFESDGDGRAEEAHLLDVDGLAGVIPVHRVIEIQTVHDRGQASVDSVATLRIHLEMGVQIGVAGGS